MMSDHKEPQIVSRRRITFDTSDDLDEKQGPVVGYRKIDVDQPDREVENKTRIRLSDPLPQELQTVLNELRPELPPAYKNKVRAAAYFFWSLEEDKELEDENGQSLHDQREIFLQQLCASEFIWFSEMNFRGFNGPPLEQVLPAWIMKRNIFADAEEDKFPEADRVHFENFYQHYNHQVGAREYRTSEGQTMHEYHRGVLQDPRPSLIETNFFKCYIENGNLQNSSGIEAALSELELHNLHPSLSKFFDGSRLVLYWNARIHPDVEKQIRATFLKQRVRFRGFGQDPYQLEMQADGSYQKEMRFSNDGSLGEGSGNRQTWRGNKYDLIKFFQQYIRLVTQGAKDPVEPYLLGFLPIVISPELQSNQQVQIAAQELKQQLETEEDLPVYISIGQKFSPF